MPTNNRPPPSSQAQQSHIKRGKKLVADAPTARRRVVALVAMLLLDRAAAQGSDPSHMCTKARWPQRAEAVQAACCGPDVEAGHRRAQDDECQLPTECPSELCARVFVPFRQDCGDLIASVTALDPSQEARYNQLATSCQALLSPEHKVEAPATAELCDQEKVVCHDGNQCHVECADASDRADPATCASLLPSSAVAQFNHLIQSSPVVFFGSRNDQATTNAAQLLWYESICHEDAVLDAPQTEYLRCLYPHETVMGIYPATSFVFLGGKFLGNGFTLTGIPPDELEQRLAGVGAELTCGRAAEPPPPPPGPVNACVAPGSTAVATAETTLHHACAPLKQRLRGCDAYGDSGPWNDFMGCAFNTNHWAHFRVGGQGGCSGPTLFAFCEQEFAGDPDMIRCCSNSRCAWSASLFGDGGGQPACITDDWAVNICCEPCTCWLSPQPADGSPGGSGNMSIVEHGHEGRDYPVLVNSDGLAVAAPFPCAETGLFGRRGVLQMETWQAAMGDCSHNPMDGR